MKRRERNGFTLVELLLVITILGILAAIAVPRFFPQAEKARVAEAIGILSAIRQGEEAFFLENGSYLPISATSPTATWQQIGITDPNPGANYFSYVVNTNAPANTAFTARATRNATADPGGNATTVIGLNGNGNFCGNHPNTPPNAGVAAPQNCPR